MTCIPATSVLEHDPVDSVEMCYTVMCSQTYESVRIPKFTPVTRTHDCLPYNSIKTYTPSASTHEYVPSNGAQVCTPSGSTQDYISFHSAQEFMSVHPSVDLVMLPYTDKDEKDLCFKSRGTSQSLINVMEYYNPMNLCYDGSFANLYDSLSV